MGTSSVERLANGQGTARGTVDLIVFFIFLRYII
jgi:hypothetical protein